MAAAGDNAGDCSREASEDLFGDEFDGDSACSTPFVSAPSSPGRQSPSLLLRPGCVAGVFYSAPASPTRFPSGEPGDLEFEFDFSARFAPGAAAAAATADELFLNGQIRPMRLASHLLRPQALPPLLELDGDGDKAGDGPSGKGEASSGRSRLRSRSLRRKARSLSPLRGHRGHEAEAEAAAVPAPVEPAASRSSSSSSTTSTSSSSSSKSSKKWVFFKDLLLHRSKSEGSGTRNARPFMAPVSFFKERSKSKEPAPPPAAKKETPSPAPARRKMTAQERIYAARRAEAEAARRRTALPYRPGLLGCFGVAGAGGAVAGIARGLNAAVSST